MGFIRDISRNAVTSSGKAFRAKRIGPFIEQIENCYNKHGRVNILDIGGTRKYWDIIDFDELLKMNVKITLVNLPGQDDNECDNDVFSYRKGDGCNLNEFMDKQFDIVHSNSVIEHVGGWERMKMFSREVKRLGNGYFIQTPNFWFPIEPHFITPFFHWLPEVVRMWIIMHTGLGHHEKASSVDDAIKTIQSARLLNRKMMESLFSEASIIKERLFFVPKSIIALKVLD